MMTPAETHRSFDILIRKKIPYWSALLMGLVLVCFVFLLLLYFVLYPSKNVSGEMQTAYYIIVVPDWLKGISAYSFIGIILLVPIYIISKSYKPGMITFQEDNLQIKDQSTRQVLNESIKKVFVNDVNRWIKRPREATEVVIRLIAGGRISFLLRNYEDTSPFIDSLSALENVEFVFYNEFSMNTHDDD
jgi:hypothetical protein